MRHTIGTNLELLWYWQYSFSSISVTILCIHFITIFQLYISIFFLLFNLGYILLESFLKRKKFLNFISIKGSLKTD